MTISLYFLICFCKAVKLTFCFIESTPLAEGLSERLMIKNSLEVEHVNFSVYTLSLMQCCSYISTWVDICNFLTNFKTFALPAVHFKNFALSQQTWLPFLFGHGYIMSLHKKWSLPIRISSVNMTKSGVSCGILNVKPFVFRQLSMIMEWNFASW